MASEKSLAIDEGLRIGGGNGSDGRQRRHGREELPSGEKIGHVIL